jgi:hypothetical protein
LFGCNSLIEEDYTTLECFQEKNNHKRFTDANLKTQSNAGELNILKYKADKAMDAGIN